MTKTTYRRNHLIWSLITVLDRQSMAIMVGSIVPGPGEVAESFYLIKARHRGGREWAWLSLRDSKADCQ